MMVGAARSWRSWFAGETTLSIIEPERPVDPDGRRLGPEGVALAKERGVYKGRRPTLSEEDRAEVRKRAASGESKLQLPKQYGIGRETVYQYLRSHASGAAPGGNQAT
jgi:hypothetical protein